MIKIKLWIPPNYCPNAETHTFWKNAFFQNGIYIYFHSELNKRNKINICNIKLSLIVTIFDRSLGSLLRWQLEDRELQPACVCLCMYTTMWFQPPGTPPPPAPLLFTLAFKCSQPPCCVLTGCMCCCPIMLPVWIPPVLSFWGSGLQGCESLPLLATLSCPPRHCDLNHPDSRLVW